MTVESGDKVLMSKAQGPACSPKALLDLYFLDARSKLIDIAAFLDRIERAGGNAGDDHRMEAFEQALKVAAGQGHQKAKAVQMIFSDPTTEPIESAAEIKGATGAWPGKREEGRGAKGQMKT